MKRMFCIFYSFMCLFTAAPAQGYSLFSREFGRSGYDIELDPYYSCIEFYTGLSGDSRPHLGESEEKEIYRYLIKRAFLPTTALLEFSTYPLPWAGVAVKKNYSTLYNRAQLGDTSNLINFVTEGFQEPYAVSFFLGNLVSFCPAGVKKKDISGKAYMGYLVSAGDYHIKDCDLVEDNWVEFEWKVKGERITDTRKMKWSYRAGTKQHENPFIKDVLYFSVSRNRTDFGKQTFLNNAGAEYTIDYDPRNSEVIRHLILVGKSFPQENKKYAFQLHIGFIWEKGSKYTGPLQKNNGKDLVDFMFRPNIVF